jgi:hypothetical protein
MIDILIPVLGRPHRAQPLADNIHQATSVPHRIWFLTSPQEHSLYIEAVPDEGVILVEGVNHQYPTKINVGYRHSGIWASDPYPFVFNASDDLEFTRGWDNWALLEMTKDYAGLHVVATNDRANSQVKKGLFGTHCLIRRSYIDEQGGSLDGPGTVLSEAYDHNFVDRELCHLAQHRGVYAFAQRSIVKHNHPLHSSHVRMDATYRKGLASFHQDQALFFQRAAQWNYEGLSPQERRIARNQQAKAKR